MIAFCLTLNSTYNLLIPQSCTTGDAINKMLEWIDGLQLRIRKESTTETAVGNGEQHLLTHVNESILETYRKVLSIDATAVGRCFCLLRESGTNGMPMMMLENKTLADYQLKKGVRMLQFARIQKRKC